MISSLSNACLMMLAALSMLSFFSGTSDAQELRKTLNDYRNDRPFQYQPSDPFVRSKAFQVQTKHYGLFYNCDNEECKRNSPHICWKTHHEKDLPTTMTVRERIRHEVAQVKQRILDGAGMCASGCNCQNCQTPHSTGGCSCSECSRGGELFPAPSIMPIDGPMEVAPPMGGTYLGRTNNRYRSPQAKTEVASSKQTIAREKKGLVGSGRAIDDSRYLIREQQRDAEKSARVAEKVTEPKQPSLLERFRQLNR